VDIVGTAHNALRPTQDWIDAAKVDEYVSRLQAGEKLDPIEVNQLPNGEQYILDGHHRYVASMLTGIPVDQVVTVGVGPVGLELTRFGGRFSSRD
jgi:ParB-like chromosome segregation protein Spo0J